MGVTKAVHRAGGPMRTCWSVALGLGLVVVAGAQTAPSTQGAIAQLRGQVESQQAQAAQWEKAVLGLLLGAGDGVRTGDDGWTAILMADETLIQVNRNSRFWVQQSAPVAGWFGGKAARGAALGDGSHYRVEEGEIWLRNKNINTQIELSTPSVSAAVRGTELNLRMLPDGTTEITVIEGLITASNPLGSMNVLAGEQVLATPGQPLQKRLLVSPDDAVQWIVQVPAVFGPREIALTSTDRAVLEQEVIRIEAARASTPDDVGVLVALARVYRDLGRTEEAAALFGDVLARQAGQPDALVGLGWTWLDRGEPDRASDVFAQDPAPGPMNLLGRSLAHVARGEPGLAAAVIAEARGSFPEHALLAAQEGYLLLTSGRVIDGQAALEQAVARQPDQASAWSLLAVTRLARGDKPGARGAAEQALTVARHSPAAWLASAAVAQSEFRLADALAATDEALRLNPDHVGALVNRATLLFSMDRAEAAWEAIQRAQELAPNDPEVLTVTGFLQLGRGDVNEARVNFERVRDLGVRSGEAHLGLALAHMRAGRTDAALQAITTAVLLEPRRALFLSYWAKMLYQLGRFQRALDVLEMAAALDPRDPTPHLYRALILRDLNRPTEAIGELNRAIALNDNRAVYRSRFLLDRDLAVGNVALSLLYRQLGMGEWARNAAMASVKSDYMNAAGHLFLAGALFEADDLGRAAAGEALLARILQPANVNTFNQFNEYTTLFDQPSLDGVLSGTVGNDDTRGGSGTLSGAVPEHNVAFAAGGNSSQTDGWRDADAQDVWGASGQVKWQPSPRHNFTVTSSHSDWSRGEDATPSFDYASPAESVAVSDDQTDRVELGYLLDPSPNADVILFYSHFRLRGDQRASSFLDVVPTVAGDAAVNSVSILDVDQDADTAQAQFHYRAGDHQFILGSVGYWEDRAVSGDLGLVAVLPDGTTFSVDESTIDRSLPRRFYSTYVQDVWHVLPSVSVEGAVYYDQMEANNLFSGAEWDQSELNPRVGVAWQVGRRDTLRAAAFRYLLPMFTTRVDPQDVAGVPVFRNAFDGSQAEEIDLIWEHTWEKGLFSAGVFHLDREATTMLIDENGAEFEDTADGSLQGGTLSWNQLIGNGYGLSALYRYADVEDEDAAALDRADHRLSAGLAYVHASGVRARVTETFRREDFDAPAQEDEDIWLTDVGTGYEFPGKRASIDLTVLNLFDEQFNWVTDTFVFSGRTPSREILLTGSVVF